MKIERAINLAIENVYREGLTDIFPRPYEIECLRNNEFKKELTRNIMNRIRGNSLQSFKVNPIQHVLVPKKTAFDFRRAALMLPYDTILYLAIVLQIADVIEQNRIPRNHKRVFSYRLWLRPKKGHIFNPYWNFTSFRSHVQRKAKQKNVKFVVECDIANYYDRLNLHRLEQVLLSLKIEKPKVKIINELLLFWANRDSYGLPVGSNASRILAEAALIPIDNFLVSREIHYSRFVDDFRLFAPDITTANFWLTSLIERLSLEGLFINPRKTKIEDVSQVDVEKEIKVQEVKKRKSTRIFAGYTGLIPTKFREASKKERERLVNLDADSLSGLLEEANIIDPKDFTNFLKYAIYTENFDYLKKIPDLLPKFPQLTPYTVDLLIKKSQEIPDEIRVLVQRFFIEWLNYYPELPEYLAISIVRLLGADNFEDKDALMAFFRNLKRNSGAYIGRATLDALRNVVEREDVIEIRPYYQRADLWEKRAIIKLVDENLDDDEKRPWLKNIRSHLSDDLFSIEIFGNRKRKRKRRSRQHN